ncbi:hypothetical protein [Streptomyces sp. RB110-2]|uniref:aromatic-ring hydroxylase C-terminal domain-containing protein n=1 Tax=Streptomyces sp. RB110-2 TaxID=2794863 RepID=UPI0035ABA358
MRGVGAGGDYADTEGTFTERYGVADGGAVLVRPDGVVAWRAGSAPEGDVAATVTGVLRRVPSRWTDPEHAAHATGAPPPDRGGARRFCVRANGAAGRPSDGVRRRGRTGRRRRRATGRRRGRRWRRRGATRRRRSPPTAGADATGRAEADANHVGGAAPDGPRRSPGAAVSGRAPQQPVGRPPRVRPPGPPAARPRARRRTRPGGPGPRRRS